LKKISNLIFRNFLWKCLSVVLAALMWLICINVVNPIVTKTFANRLVIKNLDVVEANGYILLNREELENQLVRVNVRAAGDSFTYLNDGSFQPYIDVSPIDYLRDANIGRNQPLNVYVENKGAAAMSSFNPASIDTNPLTVNIKLDKIISVEKAVTVNVTGTPLESYVALAGQATPDTVTIRGPSTLLNRISTVPVEVNTNGAGEDLIAYLTPRIIDIDNRDITEQVEVNVNYVEVKVPINMYAKIPVRQDYTGTAAYGYEVVSVERSVEYIEVVGAEYDIKALSYIKLPDLDVSGWAATDSVSFDVRPELIDTSVSVVNGTPNEVVVTVNIAKQIKKEISLDSAQIQILGNSEADGEAEIIPQSLTFTVMGLAENINAFDETKISGAFIDVQGLEPGTHELLVSIVLPRGVYFDGAQPVAEVLIPQADEDEVSP